MRTKLRGSEKINFGTFNYSAATTFSAFQRLINLRSCYHLRTVIASLCRTDQGWRIGMAFWLNFISFDATHQIGALAPTIRMLCHFRFLHFQDHQTDVCIVPYRRRVTVTSRRSSLWASRVCHTDAQNRGYASRRRRRREMGLFNYW